MTMNRKVLVAGATGLVGSHILQRLLEDDSVSEIHVLSRRSLTIQHSKLQIYLIDFKSLPVLPHIDEVYLAIGTTIKQAGSREAFKAIDLETNYAVAKAGVKAGAKRLGLVSAMSARADSMLFYNRVKGQLEDRLSTFPFESFVIVRPSFLLGSREALDQPKRYAEKFGILLFKLLTPFLPINFRAIEAPKVALALVSLVPKASGKKVVFSGEILKLFPRSTIKN